MAGSVKILSADQYAEIINKRPQKKLLVVCAPFKKYIGKWIVLLAKPYIILWDQMGAAFELKENPDMKIGVESI